MKRVTASEARKNWFRILDEVAAGEVVYIERGGRRIVLTRDAGADEGQGTRDYSGILRVSDASNADRWGWEWPGPQGDLEPTTESDDE